MKQQFTNVLFLVDTKNVKTVLNCSTWDYEYSGHQTKGSTIVAIINRLEKGLFSEKAIIEKLDECKTYDSSVTIFDDYYNEIHPYNEGDEIDIADLIDNVNYWFAQFIAADMAAAMIPDEHKHVLESYTFSIK
jgi:hypothetical protein